MTERPDKPLTVRVIRWEGLDGFGWGVDVDRGNGKHDAYPVGAQEAAEAEAKRIRSGGAARRREEVERMLDRFLNGAETEAVNGCGYAGVQTGTVICSSGKDIEDLLRTAVSKCGSCGSCCQRDWPQQDSSLDQRTSKRCAA